MFVVTVLVVVSVCTAAATPVPSWYGLGPEACHGETCKIEQFCSNSQLDPLRGCRNCTDIVNEWCEDGVPEEFLRKYPSCQAACERLLTERREAASQNKTDELEIDNDHLRSSLRDTEKKLHETENKTRYMDASLTTARKDKSKLQAELDMLRNKTVSHVWQIRFFVAAFAALVVLFLLLMSCVISRRTGQNKRDSTAVPQRKLSSNLWRCLQWCFIGSKQQRHVVHPVDEEHRPLQDVPASETTGPYAPCTADDTQPTDAQRHNMQPSDDHTSNEHPCGATGNMNNVQPASGSQTSSANSSPKSDRSSLSDMVAPGPGTEHHQGDLDFNRKAASCQESTTEQTV